MKQLIISLALASLLMITGSIHAQVSITQSDMPTVGDTIRYSITDQIGGFDFQQTGAGLTWDFSMLEHQSQQVQSYLSASAINTLFGIFFGMNAIASPMEFEFPNSPIDIPDFYSFHKKSASLYTKEGYGGLIEGFPVPMKFSDVDELYNLPLEYEDFDSTTYNGVLALSDTFYFSTSGSRVTIVDGWGSISTPYGTKECIRLETTVYSRDSLSYQGLPQPVCINAVSRYYQWLSPGEKFPMLEVSGLVNEAGFVPSLVRYRDYYRPLMPPMPIASFDADPLNCFTHDTVRFHNFSTPIEPLPQYQWVINPPTFSYIEGTNNQSFEPIVLFEQQGAYDISLIVTNEAGSDTLERLAYINVSSDVSIEGRDAFDGIAARVYPNPVLDVCNVEAVFFISMIDIYDMDGKLCMRHEYRLPKDQIVLDFSAFKEGIYLLRLYQAGQNTAVTLKVKKG